MADLMRSNPDKASAEAKGKGKGKSKGGAKNTGALVLQRRGSIIINPKTGKEMGRIPGKKPKRNPTDLAGTLNAMVKADGMQILEGGLVYLGARFVVARVVLPIVPVAYQGKARQYAPALSGVLGAAVELYRGKKTAAIVCLSAGAVSQVVDLAVPKLVQATGGALSGEEPGPFLSGEREEIEQPGEVYLGEIEDEGDDY